MEQTKENDVNGVIHPSTAITIPINIWLSGTAAILKYSSPRGKYFGTPVLMVSIIEEFTFVAEITNTGG